MNEKVYTSKPVNKTAALVTSNHTNDEIRSNNYGHNYMSLERPPTIIFQGSKRLNLHGLSFGKLTVIGVFIKQTPRKKLKWVCQCKCGYYLIRVSNTIRNKMKSGNYDECARCRVESKRINPSKL